MGLPGWAWRAQSSDLISCGLQSLRLRGCCHPTPVQGQELTPSCAGAAVKELIIFLHRNRPPFICSWLSTSCRFKSSQGRQEGIGREAPLEPWARDYTAIFMRACLPGHQLNELQEGEFREQGPGQLQACLPVGRTGGNGAGQAAWERRGGTGKGWRG